MKRIIFMGIAIMAIFVSSCKKEELETFNRDVTSQDEVTCNLDAAVNMLEMPLVPKLKPYTLVDGYNMYVKNNKGGYSKYSKNIFQYDILLGEGTKDWTILENDTSANFRILNMGTGEYADIINIQNHESFYVFDVQTSNGKVVRGLEYFIGENKNVWVEFTVAVIGWAIDILTDSSLEECKEAMASLDCSGGTNPYMEYDSGWFSTTCRVGCH